MKRTKTAVALKAKPRHQFSWTDITMGEGIPYDLYKVKGLYAIYKDDTLLYIGISSNLTQRLGQAVGAICGGTGLHSGGNNIYERWEELPEGELWFEVFIGNAVYNREQIAIETLAPIINRQRGRRG